MELTHNHGTEDDASFVHFCGNEADRKGFGHIGFLVEDVGVTCKALEEIGVCLCVSLCAFALAFIRNRLGSVSRMWARPAMLWRILE